MLSTLHLWQFLLMRERSRSLTRNPDYREIRLQGHAVGGLVRMLFANGVTQMVARATGPRVGFVIS